MSEHESCDERRRLGHFTPRERAHIHAAIEANTITTMTGTTMTACHVWTGRVSRYGYAILLRQLAHRVVYQLRIGPIEAGMTIDHLCRTRRCLNPSHMEVVPNVVNVMRGESFAARNARKTECINGHPYTTKNTYIRPGSGHRDCYACTRLRDAKKYAARRKGVNA